MIRWTEQTGCYRLEYDHRFEAVGVGILSTAMLLVAVGSMIGAAGVAEGQKYGLAAAFLCIAAVAGCVGWLAGRECSRYRSMCGWVEVSVRGCTARWGGPALPGMDTPIPVSCFRLCYDARGTSGIEAVLPDGGHRHVLGLWGDDHAARRIKLVEELNANLSSVESSAATIVPPPARLTGEPDKTAQRRLQTWRDAPLPHRLVVADRRWMGVITGMGATILLGMWSLAGHRPCTGSLLSLFCVGTGLGWVLEWRYARWIDIVSTEGRIRWGRGRDLILGEEVVATFQAEPQRGLLGQDSRWTVVGYRADGQRVVPFEQSLRVSLTCAARSAWLLNRALVPRPSGEAGISR